MFFTRISLARKAWKSITSTLGKIHKIHRSKSKAMKKTKKHINTTTTTTTTKPSNKAIVTKHSSRHNRRLVKIKSVIYSLKKKKHAPIYIDNLFKETYSSCDLVNKLKPEIIAQNNPIPLIEKIEEEEEEEEVGGTSKGCNSNDDDDNIWESLALESPLMDGIDERAERFIARFREEMAAQEKLATNL